MKKIKQIPFRYDARLEEEIALIKDRLGSSTKNGAINGALMIAGAIVRKLERSNDWRKDYDGDLLKKFGIDLNPYVYFKGREDPE